MTYLLTIGSRGQQKALCRPNKMIGAVLPNDTNTFFLDTDYSREKVLVKINIFSWAEIDDSYSCT